MSLKGNFESFYMNSIFKLLNDEQKTGILRVVDGAKEIRIYFLDGNIVYAMGSQKQDRLGAFIKKQSVISNDQLKACLAKGKQEKKALGKILVEQGYITEEKLNEIIRHLKLGDKKILLLTSKNDRNIWLSGRNISNVLIREAGNFSTADVVGTEVVLIQKSAIAKIKEVLDAQIELIEPHVDDHKWFMQINDRDEAVRDFIEKYGFIMREFYCSRICEERFSCLLAEKYNPK